MSSSIFIKTTKTARVSVSGEITAETKNIWFVIHGYGELTPYFIRKFSTLQYPENVVIAPEALSRFYLNGFNGRVGATWMTKEERLIDIEDYINYLDTVYDYFVNNSPCKIHVIGFSQGAATAIRWLGKTKNKIDSFSLWCSVFPPDLAVESTDNLKKIDKLFFVYGNSDEILSLEKVKDTLSELRNNGLEVEEIPFEGGHIISTLALKDLQNKLTAL